MFLVGDGEVELRCVKVYNFGDLKGFELMVIKPIKVSNGGILLEGGLVY